MKKVFVLAVLVLAATAASNSRDIRKKVMKDAMARFTKGIHKREEDSCKALTCAKEFEPCTDDSQCQFTTKCTNGICLRYALGDSCYSGECFNSSLFCDENDYVCRKYNVEGDSCTDECHDLNNELYCSSVTSTCKPNPKNVGDACEYGSICPPGSQCTGTSETPSGTCVALPNTVGADCSEYGACNESNFLFCDALESTCKALAGLNEHCDSDSDCGGDLRCGHTNNLCSKEYSERGEYCDRYDIWCKNDLEDMCYDEVCVKKDGRCVDAEDCIYCF